MPASEWLIYRRLWKLPAAGGFAALLRKLISNEVLLGYSGEVAFYAWARNRSRLTTAPFGAIKDVSVTSALAGNIATLAMLLVAWPHLRTLHLSMLPHLAWSIAAVLAITAAIGLWRGRIFSLPPRDLRFILQVHLVRLAATTCLSALLWHFALPTVALATWIMLAALQLLVTRLPFVPNKDLVFAAATLLLIGDGSRIGVMIALVATLILAAHLVVGAALAIVDLFETVSE